MAARRIAAASFGLAVVLLAGCTIKRNVEPVPGPLDATLCVRENPEASSKEFLETLCDELERHAVRTWVYQTDRPADCRYHVTYSARWHWGSLQRADIRVLEDDRLIGRAVYDASRGLANPFAFGSTRTKLRALVDELMRNADPPSS